MANVRYPNWITISPAQDKLSRTFADDVIRIGNIAGHLAVRGAERDPEVWYKGKLAECVFAIECGQDPAKVLHWDPYNPDNGWDVMHNGVKNDVKATYPQAECLIWPIGKNDLFAGKDFDALVLTKINARCLVGFSYGWVPKAVFAAEHKIARPGMMGPGSKLDPGTWFMEQGDIWSMDDLWHPTDCVEP